jgi:hypothetical protein
LIVRVFARDALDEEVALGQETDEDAFQHCILPRDHPPDLEQGLLEALAPLVGHVGSLRRVDTVIHDSTFS